MKITGHEHRNGGKRQTSRAGAQIGREGHLADVELQPPAHPPHHRDDLLDLDEAEVEPPQICARRLYGLGYAVIAQRKRQRLHRKLPVRNRYNSRSAPFW
jgi:hypothetical protein